MRDVWTYNAKLIDVTDGDTVKLRVDCGFRMFYEWAFRLYGINAPERHTDAGKASKRWLEHFLEKEIEDGAEIEVVVHKHGKYRWIATLYTIKNSQRININEKLVDIGHAIYQRY